MIKYFCDRCGKEISYANGYTIPPMMKNENGIMHHGGFFICNECYHKWREVKDRVSDIDFVEMSDKELQPYRCDFKIGDKVLVISGPFTDRIVEVVAVSEEKEIVTVLVEFFGRPSPTELKFNEVKKLESAE